MTMKVFSKPKILKIVITTLLFFVVIYIIQWRFLPKYDARLIPKFRQNPLIHSGVNVGNPDVRVQKDVGPDLANPHDYEDALLSDLYNVPAMKAYCNSPFNPVEGFEGSSIEGLTLQMVHVLTRHGDRASIHHLNNFQSPDISCEFKSWFTGDDHKISKFPYKLSEFLDKQSPGSYFLNWPMFPDSQTCEHSALTSQGALQQIHIGQFLHQKYMKELNLFGNEGGDIDQVQVFSTSTRRTYQSAIALLYGFLPDFNVTRLNIDPVTNVYFCRSQHSKRKGCACKYANELLSRSKTYETNARTDSHKRLQKSLSNMFGTENEHIPSLSHIIDTVAPSICHSLSVPCSNSDPSQCIDASLLTELWEETVRSQRLVVEDPQSNFLRFSSIMMYPLMAELTSRMLRKAQGQDAPHFVLYSGHDLTLTPLLHVLGIYDGIWPPYASRIVIEMFRSDQTTDPSEVFVRILYNGRDVTNRVTFCKISKPDELCRLTAFSEFVFSEMLQRFQFSDFSSACSNLRTR